MRTMTDLQARLDELIAMHRVPGAALAVLENGTVTEAASGVTSVRTGVPVTPDTVFQYGSIGKVFTTTVIMQLVGEGKLDLDAPVRRWLPELRLADEDAAGAITLRQLLTHTSGIDGDHFLDTGRGDDCLERYVASLADVPQIAPPGAIFSYCNAGFVIAGRIIETLTGTTWDAAIKERIDPTLITFPEEALLHRAAVGHVLDGEQVVPAKAWMLPRSVGPAGLICGTAAQLLAFVRAHLDATVLPSDLAEQMRTEQFEMPDKVGKGSHWGLGWILFDWDGRRVIGHDGGTIGQYAFLRVVPETGYGVALLTNGPGGGPLALELLRELFASKGIALPAQPSAADGPVAFDADALAGTYERLNVRTEIAARDGGLVASFFAEGPTADSFPPVRDEPLKPIDATSFLITLRGQDVPLVFFERDGVRYLHVGGRASRRTA